MFSNVKQPFVWLLMKLNNKFAQQLEEVRTHLENAHKVFLEKLKEQVRQVVWIDKMIYSPVSSHFSSTMSNIYFKINYFSLFNISVNCAR